MAIKVHLRKKSLIGKEYKGVDNADYYKKLKNNVPNFKSDKQLKNDLLIIKPFFQQTELKEIVKMIDSVKSLPGSWVYLVLRLAGNRVTEQALHIWKKEIWQVRGRSGFTDSIVKNVKNVMLFITII